jgi:hypothetical protein
MSKSASNLYLLSFIDAMDRLDILMLEIRHLQQTIIYSLRAPSLYLPLRYEEKYLFGDHWDDEMSKVSTIGRDAKIASEWLVRYPSSKSAVDYYCDHPTPENKTTKNNNYNQADIIKSIENRIKHRVGQIWLGDNWMRDQRRQYHSLYALQILKQHVLCDKISLARAALQANLLDSTKKHSVLQKPAFLILRKGVLFKADEYVLILRNHKHQISQSIEFGMPSDPHPSTERRRDMGIFMDFIFNRTIDIQGDILHLYQYLKGTNKGEHQENSLLMFHGWSQNTRVSTLQLDDVISATHRLFDLSDPVLEAQGIGYINTSFWTPDRPDLHPMIAYPVAKSVIYNTLNDLSEVVLSNNNDKFTELMINIKSIFIREVKKTPALHYLKKDIDNYLKKIAADLLAATVKGVAYLYSLFLVIIGDALASQLYVGKEVKLDMVYSLEQGTATYEDAILWYLRLNIIAFWIDNIIDEKTSIEESIIKEVKIICDDLLVFLDNYTPIDSNKVKPYWQMLLMLFTNEINNSSAMRTSKIWREHRAEDNGGENKNIAYDDSKCFSRSTRKLNIRLQNYLFREVLLQKTKSEKPLHNKFVREGNNKYINKNKFKSIYFSEIEEFKIIGEEKNSLCHPKKIFDHIYDISYQAAYFRSIDLLHGKKLSNKKLFEQLHWDMELGRGLFSIALEFYMRDIESPEQRLSLCVNQIAYMHDDIKKQGNIPELVNKLHRWLTPSENIEIKFDSLIALIDTLKLDSSALGANKLVQAFEKTHFGDQLSIRQLEVIAGYKLRDLFAILEDEKNYNNNHHVKKSFSALVQFLSLRRCDSDKEDRPTKKALFYNSMLAALGDINEKTKIEYEQEEKKDKNLLNVKFFPPSVKSVMLHRLSITNYTPISDPVYLNNANDNKNGRYLAKNLRHRDWKTTFLDKGENHTWTTLGRFDATSMAEVRLPCKCYIQGFKEGQSLPWEGEECLNEEFSPHFSRREIARPVDILPEEKSDAISYQMFSMLSVTLQRRSIRLDFLYRIIRALNDNNLKKFQSGLETEIINLKKNNIFVKGFLTDGWGDVLFKFTKAESKNSEIKLTEGDIEHIFNFQRAVYEDFMVDRTEITFSPQCIDYTLAYNEKYAITMEARMLEDRWLETGVDKYNKNLLAMISTLKEEGAKQKNKKIDFLEDIEITMIPGRHDFSFKFIVKNDAFFVKNKEKYPNRYIKDAYFIIIDWLDENEQSTGAIRMLSHIETHIGKILKPESAS